MTNNHNAKDRLFRKSRVIIDGEDMLLVIRECECMHAH